MIVTLMVFGYLGRVVRKPVNVNPGLKVNRDNNFSSIKMISTAYVLCSFRLFMLKRGGQKI